MDLSLSDDELAASLGVRYPSPARARPDSTYLKRKAPLRAQTPLAPRSPNVKRRQLDFDVTPSMLRGASPSKSIMMDAGNTVGQSPWRIKVTVQAEPGDESLLGHSPAARSRVFRVPLKDADGSSPGKGGEGKKQKAGSGIAIKKRKGTPLRRRSSRLSTGKESTEAENLESEAQTETLTAGPRMLPRKRGRKKIMTEVGASAINEPASGGLPTSIEPEGVLERREGPKEDLNPSSPENLAHKEKDDGNEDVDSGMDIGQGHEETTRIREHSHIDRSNASSSGKFLPPFDFSSLTPLHMRHSLGPENETAHVDTLIPTKRNTFGTITASEHKLPNPNLYERPALSLRKSPEPFTRKESSPATENDALMWRHMIHKPKVEVAEQSGEEDAEEEGLAAEDSDSEVPDATSRTIGEATMMQSEDFSIVSLSSLQSVKDINSSLLGRSEVDQSTLSVKEPSHLRKTVTFSSPLQTRHDIVDVVAADDSDEEVHDYLDDEDSLLQHPEEESPVESSPTGVRGSVLQPRLGAPENDLPLSQPPNERSLSSPSVGVRAHVSQSPHQESLSQTPFTEAGRLPTPNSSDNLTSSPPQSPKRRFQSYTASSQVQSSPYVDGALKRSIEATPSRSEAEMSTPPRTPTAESLSPQERNQKMRDTSVSSKRSWIDEPQSPRMLKLERKWERERLRVRQAMERALGRDVITIEDDGSSSDGEVDQDVVQPSHATQSSGAAATTLPATDATKDVWQDISASYDIDGLEDLPRRTKPVHARPRIQERPTKKIRLDHQQQPGHTQKPQREPLRDVTPEHIPPPVDKGLASVKRRENVASDISAIFGRVAVKPTINISGTALSVPKAPSPLRQSYTRVDVSDMDISGLSDVRQIRNEIRQAQRRPPFSVAGARSMTTTVPTKTKSIDDTLTTQEDSLDEELCMDDGAAERSSLLSLNSQPRPSFKLFGDDPARPLGKPHANGTVEIKKIATTTGKRFVSASSDTAQPSTNIFTSLYRAITFSQPYVPLSRPTHPILVSSPENFPLLPRVWPWSRTHWRALDALYQYYKRKPSRFAPSRTAPKWPDNIGLITDSWVQYIDSTFEHWGYRVRLEDTHIVLAIVFTQLLVLPGEREYKKLHSGEGLDWGECDPTARKGERIDELEVLVRLFSVIAGEMLAEDEDAGRMVRRDLVKLRWKPKGGEWICLNVPAEA